MSKIKSAANITNTIKSATSIPKGETIATIILQNLQVSLGGVKSTGFVNTKTVSLTLPLKDNSDITQLHQEFRGNIFIDDGVRGLLVIQSSGVTTMIKNFCDITEGDSGDFNIPVDVTVPPSSDCHITMYLLIDRDVSSDSEPGGMLSVEELVVSIV